MKNRFDLKTVGGAAILLAMVAIFVAALTLMDRVGIKEYSFTEWAGGSCGWSYELLTDNGVLPYEPRFSESGYTLVMPEKTTAVRITRRMTEYLQEAQLEWNCGMTGVELFLNGEIIYTDFPNAVREDDGFLRPTQEDWDRISRKLSGSVRWAQFSLPQEYLGGTLTVISYYPEGYEELRPVYPRLNNQETIVAPLVVGNMKDSAVMTFYVILSLLISVLFFLDMRNQVWDGKMLLLSLYFLMQFLKVASYAGYYSELRRFMNVGLFNRLYMAPLYLYLTLRLKGRWKLPFSGMVIVWMVYEVVLWFLNTGGEVLSTADIIGPGSMVVCCVTIAALGIEKIRENRDLQREKKQILYCVLTAVAVIALHLCSKAFTRDSLGSYLSEIWFAFTQGNFAPVMEFVTGVISSLTVIAVILEFLRRTIYTWQEMSVLQDRTRQTVESYNRLLETEEITNALRHEMSHHMTALSGILKAGDIKRADRYVDAVIGDLAQIPEGRYSKNMLVNMIVGSYLDKARKEQIRVEHHLNVPSELNIADEDLSVFLSNMLQNALEACARMEPEEDRYIKLGMHLREKFLFIECVNSAPDEKERHRRPGHGYGLAAMRAVAEKYNSVLVTEHKKGKFLVMSDLCLNRNFEGRQEDSGIRSGIKNTVKKEENRKTRYLR